MQALDHLFAGQALAKLLEVPDALRVLDVGSGAGDHAAVMRTAGKKVITISLTPPADFVGNFLRYDGDMVDAIWASHVLEHQPNVHMFLRHCYKLLREDGVLAVTVPPRKDALVGGHMNLFTQGTLLYNLILAGFDCARACVSHNYVGGPLETPYNLSVLVRKREAKLPGLTMDHGDIERLAPYFPMPVWQDVDGMLFGAVNWEKPV